MIRKNITYIMKKDAREERGITLTFIKDGKALMDIYAAQDADEAIVQAANGLAQGAETVTGVKPSVRMFSDIKQIKNGVILTTFDADDTLKQRFQEDFDYLADSDGFAVRERDTNVYVLSRIAKGVYYGAYDLLEKNAEIIRCRGARELAVECLRSDTIALNRVNYAEKSPFVVRAFQTCGQGSKGKDHLDDGTAEYLSVNKMNGTAHGYDPSWRKFSLKGYAMKFDWRTPFNALAEEHPEYFMTDAEGRPRVSARVSYLNYYNADAAKALARIYAKQINENDDDCIYEWIMPDDPYFCMTENGERLDKKPFTTDDGTTVCPEDENYKSTVYFTFMNRMMEELVRLAPQAELYTLAYIYSERVPAIRIHDRLIVMIAPITTNEKYSYVDETNQDNEWIKNNIYEWTKKCKRVCLYTYWNSMKPIYSRPLLKQIQENLLWFEKIGVYGVDVEGNLDCSDVPMKTERQESERVFYALNEAFVYVLQRLIWNPRLDVHAELKKYCRVVYKEVAEETYRYFTLLEKGWDENDALVWYSTGGDVYTLRFIIQAGIKDDVLAALRQAKERATTPSVVQKIETVCKVVSEQIKTYESFVKEDGSILDCREKEEDILSERALDYENNPESVWNSATPMKVLRNYQTMEFFDKKADFECRMLCDEKNVYIGYKLRDDKIVGTHQNGAGVIIVDKEDGADFESCAETYIGGNALNQSTYYGYISGFRGELGINEFYRNQGTPVRIALPEGVRDVKYVHLSEDREKRYVFHVQVIPYGALDTTREDFNPYGSFVYLTDRYGRAGWMGYGLWNKQSFSVYQFIRRKNNEKNKQ